jgi:hypothetical protein
MKNRKHLVFILVALLILNVMCVAPNLDSENFTTSEPKPSDLVGIYTPTESTWEFIKGEGGYTVTDISITLAPDGSLTMTNIPDWWSDISGQSNGQVESCQGEWGIEQVQDWWELTIIGCISNTSIPIAGEKPPYRLWFYIGDPDSGDVMIFEQSLQTP